MLKSVFSTLFSTAGMLVFAASVQADNLVMNPGFESGDFSGWTLAGTDSSASARGIFYDVDAEDAHSGKFGAFFGPVGGVLTVSQLLPTVPGQSYTIDFFLAEVGIPSFPYVNSAVFTFSGLSLLNLSQVSNAPYTGYHYTANATSSATLLQFAFRNDTGFFSLDDVSVSGGIPTFVPEPSTALGPALVLLLLLLRYRIRQSSFLHVIPGTSRL